MSTGALLRVEGTAWSVSQEVSKEVKPLKTSSDIITKLGLDWEVSAHNVKTDIEEPVPGYYGMYRDDKQQFLGIVKSANPQITQNIDMFSPVEPLIADGSMTPLIADSYMGGSQVFGCFQYNDSFKVLDDDFSHYFIVVNNHLKPDGNLVVINTPIRIACMNAMASALSRATLKFKIPAVVEPERQQIVATSIVDAYERVAASMQTTAERMVKAKITKAGIEKLLDELFPYIAETEEKTTNHDRANHTVTMQREAFLTCMKADNLQNYQGTMWQVFNALTDYGTHYFRSTDRAFDLQHRMTLIPGMNPEATTEMLKVSKFVNNMDKFAVAA